MRDSGHSGQRVVLLSGLCVLACEAYILPLVGVGTVFCHLPVCVVLLLRQYCLRFRAAVILEQAGLARASKCRL